MEDAMTVTVFGFLLMAADVLLLLTANLLVYRALRETASIDYLGALRAGGAMAQTPSNISTPERTRALRTA
jgi:hypothetical protein